jgi:hypothetical protein
VALGRRRRLGACLVGLSGALLVAPAGAQEFDGAYSGTIMCARIQGVAGPLRTRVSATVSGGQVTYERELLSAKGQPTGNFERGSGTVTESGDMAISAKVEARAVRFEAEYKGKFLADKTIRLIGAQRWQPQGRSDMVERTCFVDLGPSTAAAAAEPYDGVYSGTINCEAMRGHTEGTLRTAFSATVTDGKVSFEREIRDRFNQHTGNFERGTGTVSPSGEMTLATRAAGQGFRYDAEYKGKFIGDSIRLMGGQSWQYDRQTGRVERACFVDLVKSPPKQ